MATVSKVIPQPHDPTDNIGDNGIVGCGECGLKMVRHEANLVADDRLYLCDDDYEKEQINEKQN